MSTTVILETKNEPFRTAMLRLFAGAKPSGSRQKSQCATLPNDMECGSVTVPEGSPAFKDHNEEITIFIPRQPGDSDAAKLVVTVGVDDVVKITDTKKRK